LDAIDLAHTPAVWVIKTVFFPDILIFDFILSCLLPFRNFELLSAETLRIGGLHFYPSKADKLLNFFFAKIASTVWMLLI
jgi:hypothetical protein